MYLNGEELGLGIIGRGFEEGLVRWGGVMILTGPRQCGLEVEEQFETFEETATEDRLD